MRKHTLRQLALPLFLIASISIASACTTATPAKTTPPIEPPKPMAKLDENLEIIPNKCADDGPSFKETGICQGRASNYMNMLDGPEPKLMDSCEWTNQQIPFADMYLLYRAAKCGNKTAKLEFFGGAHSAQLSLMTSAIAPVQGLSSPYATIITTQNPKDYKSIVRYAVDTSKKENKTCHIVKDTRSSAYKEGLVIDVDKAIAAKAPKNEPRTACDDMGYDEDSANFWYISQSYAWYLHLGQDLYQDIDPRSLTIISKNKDGSWGAIQ